MSKDIKVYQRKSKKITALDSMEAEPRGLEFLSNFSPETPAKRETTNVYKRRLKADLNQVTEDKSQEQKSAKVEFTCFNSDRFAVSDFMDSAELKKFVLVSTPQNQKTEASCANFQGDTKAAKTNAGRRLNFMGSGDFRAGLLDLNVPDSEDCIIAAAKYTDQSSPQDLSVVHTNVSEAHATRCEGQRNDFISSKEDEKAHSSEPLVPVTPASKQNSKKRSRNDEDVKQRPPKRIKKHRHIPKVAVEGKKRTLKIAPIKKEKEVKKNVRKTVYKEKRNSRNPKKMLPLEVSATANVEEASALTDITLVSVDESREVAAKKVGQACVDEALTVAANEVVLDEPREVLDEARKLAAIEVTLVDAVFAASHGNDKMLVAHSDIGMDIFRRSTRLEIKKKYGCQDTMRRCEPILIPLKFKKKRFKMRKRKSKMSILISFLGLGYKGRCGQATKVRIKRPRSFIKRRKGKINESQEDLVINYPGPGQELSSPKPCLQQTTPLNYQAVSDGMVGEEDLQIVTQQEKYRRELHDLQLKLFLGMRGPMYGSIQRMKNNRSVNTLCTELKSLKIEDSKRSRKQKKINNSYALVVHHGPPPTLIGESGPLVPYQGTPPTVVGESGSLVPFQGKKQRKPKVQVHLDEETVRQWNLVMKIDDGSKDKEDREREEKWEKETQIFYGRMNSFTAKMHSILGDRRFVPWNGSVVDSVIGVFLTQNVSDSLSSFAYMNLASKFPVESSDEEIYDDELLESSEDCLRSSCVWHDNGYYITHPESKSPVHVAEESSLVDGENIGNTISIINPENSSLFSGQISNVVEGRESPHLGSLPLDCSSQMEVGTENTVQAQSVENDDMQPSMVKGMVLSTLVSKEENSSGMPSKKTRKKKVVEEPKDWTALGKKYFKERRPSQTDSVNWEGVREAPQEVIANAIKKRGQHNIMAEKIKEALNHIKELHGSINLEWLRYADEKDVSKFLLEIRGIGLKSTECLRLLTLRHKAFPVDVNVARIATRLGWVPLEPLPGDLQFHLLQEYPVMDSVQKYLWPRLAKLGQTQLYELHYHLITFGKVFCTKLNPKCDACPMRAECRHLASAIASQNLRLPAPSRKRETSSANGTLVVNPVSTSLSELNISSESELRNQTYEPIIEEPPEPEDIEDLGLNFKAGEAITTIEDDEISTIHLPNPNQLFRENVQYYMDRYWNDHHQTDESSRAIVPSFINVDSIPARKWKNIQRLRTEHLVYELPDDHPLLIGRRRRVRCDPLPYLLAIWTAGETPDSWKPPERKCNSEGSDVLCKDETCLACQTIWEANTDTVRGTILVPCRTAMNGRFPLNGTYFQVNEVFADHESSINPIMVTRNSIFHLPTRIVYFGSTPAAIFRGCSMRQIQENFHRGFICLRGWDAKTGAPQELERRFHCAPSYMVRRSTRDDKSTKGVSRQGSGKSSNDISKNGDA